MARNFTRELFKALRPGLNRAVCSVAPYEGKEVEYAPRNRHDSLPWVLAKDQDGHSRVGYRFTGRECHVQTFRYAVVESLGKFLVLDTEAPGWTTVHPAGKGAWEVPGLLASGIAYQSRYAATDTAKRLERDSRPVSAQEENIRRATETVHGTDDMRQVVRTLRGRRRDFTVTVGSHPHYFNDRSAAESFANSYGVAVTDNRK